MTGRSQKILSRFPAHLDATRPGKVLENVVDGLSRDLDVLSAALGGVRRSHRVGDAEELRDLLLLAARHGITLAELEPLFARYDRAEALLAELDTADTPELEERAEALLALWGLADPAPRLPLFARPPAEGESADLEDARVRLAQYAGRALLYGELLDGIRERIRSVARLHAVGNGTVRSLLEGASSVLSLSMGELFHSEDRFWHAATVKDAIQLERPQWTADPNGGTDVESSAVLEPAQEILGLEENPLVRAESDPKPRENAELFYLLRVGFERVLLEVRITGEQDNRTIGPMVVNRDEGHGIGFAWSVPAGETVVFTEEGRALLGSSDVTAYAYAWKGACFANEGDTVERSFLFAEDSSEESRAAVFAVSFPSGALETGFVFPHSGESIPMPGIAVGETRFAFFIQEGFYSALGGTESSPVIRLVPPRPAIGFLDGSVFAGLPGEDLESSAMVAFSWLEHQPFTVRLLIPERFRSFHADDPEGTETLRWIKQGMNRFRSAGIDLKVEYVDNRWILGQGVMTLGTEDDPIATLRSGSVLWAAPTDEDD